jgi:hypothetical protein
LYILIANFLLFSKDIFFSTNSNIQIIKEGGK